MSTSSTMTTSARDKFFSLPELIAHLAPLLSRGDLSNLSQTNRAFNSICTPALWRHLNLFLVSRRFIESPEAHEGCNANIDHIRAVLWKFDASWYYINALWKYLNSTTVMETHRVIPTDALTHPRWGQLSTAPIDDTSIQPLYPLLSLTHYTCHSSDSFYFYTDRIKPAYHRQAREPHQHQLLWLLRLNHSTLTQIQFINAPLLSPSLFRDLCKTISQLKSLKTLILTDPQPETNISLQVLEKLFFSCPPSLVELSMISFMNMSKKDMSLDPHEDDWDADQGPLLLRKEPLQYLESLQLRLIDTRTGASAPLLSSILEHCPALKKTTLPPIRHSKVVQAVSKSIGDFCPNIADLTFPRLMEDNDEAFMIIMDRMHEQRLEKVQVDSLADMSSSLLSLSAFIRHSTTLRQVEFDYCRQLASTTLQAILTSCHVLETLMVSESEFALCDRVALSLEDAVETEWVCTSIRHLTIYVKLTPDGRDPTYLADPTMSTWTEQDHHHWKMLDQFYTQIGSLRELEILSLKAASSRPNEYGGISDVSFRETCLPGLLALEDTTATIGQIGFLSRWAGLDKLQELRGSFSVTTKEVSVRMGQREVEWFAGHLPALRIASFVGITFSEDYSDMLPKVVKDLWERRPELMPIEFLWDVLNISPTPPMISAGAYYSNSTSGSLVVFDQQSNGIIYQTSTYPVNATAGSPFTLQWNITSRQEVDSGGIVLTPNAVSVDAENVAYIFDQTADNMTAVYAVRPGVSNKLGKISGPGPAHVFSKYMAAMTWKGTGGLLATYYKNITTGIAYFNLLNTTSGNWTGQELVLPPPATTSAKPSGQNTPFPSNGSGDKDMPSLIGGVAGGVVGLLVILAIVGYVFIRRGQSQQSGGQLGVFGREMDKKTTGNGSASDASVNLTVVTDPTRLSTVQGINNIKVAMYGYTGDNIKNAYFTESNRGSPHTLNTDGLYLANDVSSTKTSLPDTSATPSPPTANGAFNRALDPLEEQYRLERRNSTPQSPHAVIQNTEGGLWNLHS